MQVQKDLLNEHTGYIKTVQKVFKAEGIKGFYRGIWPPFLGSVIYRAFQMSIFELCYTEGLKYQTL